MASLRVRLSKILKETLQREIKYNTETNMCKNFFRDFET